MTLRGWTPQRKLRHAGVYIEYVVRQAGRRSADDRRREIPCVVPPIPTAPHRIDRFVNQRSSRTKGPNAILTKIHRRQAAASSARKQIREESSVPQARTRRKRPEGVTCHSRRPWIGCFWLGLRAPPPGPSRVTELPPSKAFGGLICLASLALETDWVARPCFSLHCLQTRKKRFSAALTAAAGASGRPFSIPLTFVQLTSPNAHHPPQT